MKALWEILVDLFTVNPLERRPVPKDGRLIFYRKNGKTFIDQSMIEL